jgi:hypothetical protein
MARKIAVKTKDSESWRKPVFF